MENMMSSHEYIEARNRAKEMLLKMTLAEKIGQLSQFGTSIYTDDEQNYEDHFDEGRVGSYLTIKGKEKTNNIQWTLLKKTRLPIPALFADDVIHGYRTTFPSPLAQSCSWDPEITKECNQAAAKEAYRAGIKWTFAPMVDIARDPRWGRIMEGYGEDTYLCSEFAKAAVKGFQGDSGKLEKDHVFACMKHYVAYGACIGGRDYNTADVSLQTLHDVYLPPFKAGIGAGAATVMSAFNDVGGVPATANKYLLKAVLRDEYDFKGAVISDAGAIHELVAHGFAEDEKDAAQKAFDAGVDIVMAGDLYNDNLPLLLKEGKITMEQIDESTLSVLTLKYLSGIMDEPLVDEDLPDVEFSPEHMEIARVAGAAGIVLLENNGVLPLDKKAKLLLTGPLSGENGKGELNGTWICLCDHSKTISIEEGLKKALPNTYIVQDDGKDIQNAIKLAKDVDVVIVCVGECAGEAGEANSKSNLHLPEDQQALIEAMLSSGKKVVLLVSAGRPLILTDYKNRADAIVNVWQPGTSAGDSIADVLTGKVNPSGRLTVTFPWSEGQIPIYYNHTNTGRPPLGRWQFESKYRDCPIEPLYPFGYGLSYTTFEISDVKCSCDTMPVDGEIEITANVKNTGDVGGANVVQLYVRDLVASVVRPVKELKGFKKIYINAGETVKVSFVLKAKDLAFHDQNMNLVIEPGKFKAFVAKDSQDNANEIMFEIK